MKVIYDEAVAEARGGLGASFYPSIGAMKMATYLRENQEDEVLLITSLKNAAGYDDVYFFSDKPLSQLPKEIFTLNNVHLYGAFLDPLPRIVEHARASAQIYKPLIEERLVEKKITADNAFFLLDGVYYQPYDCEGRRMPLPPSKSGQVFYIYDKDFLAKEECWDILDKIVERKPRTIVFAAPLLCHTVSQYFKVRDYTKVSRAKNKFILDYYVPPHHLDYYFSKYQLPFLGDLTKSGSTYIYLGKDYGEGSYDEIFYKHNLVYCLQLMKKYLENSLPIKIMLYERDDLINPYLPFYKKIRTWWNASFTKEGARRTLRSYFLYSQKEQKYLQELLKKIPDLNQYIDFSRKQGWIIDDE